MVTVVVTYWPGGPQPIVSEDERGHGGRRPLDMVGLDGDR
jgi:hypothetical protein